MHLPNGFPGRLPVSPPASQAAVSFPGRMPAGLDTSAAVAPPARAGPRLFTRPTQAAALPPRFPPQPPPQPPVRRLVDPEPSQPSEVEEAGRSARDGGGDACADGGSEDEGSDLEPDEMPPEWCSATPSSATPSPPPRLVRTAPSSPPPPSASGLDGHAEAVGCVDERSPSAASMERGHAVATPPQPLSAKVGLRRGSHNLPLPHGPAPPPLRASTSRCGSPLAPLEAEDAEGNKENGGDATTPRATGHASG